MATTGPNGSSPFRERPARRNGRKWPPTEHSAGRPHRWCLPARARRAGLYLTGVLAGLLSAGCLAHTQCAAVDVDAREWSRPAFITFTNADTVTLRDLRLFFRCNERFSADTLPLRVMLLSPDSLRCEERIVLHPVRNELPAARTRICELPYRSRVQLTDTGSYRLIIGPETPQRGIEAVGINIVKSE